MTRVLTSLRFALPRAGIGTLALLAALAALPLRAQMLPRAKPEDVGISTERLQRVRDVIGRYVASGDISGAVTLVARKGHIVFLEAQGVTDLNSKAPMRTDSMFRLASMTKPVTSAAVMMMFEDGRLHLTDPVSQYIPQFKNQRVAVGHQATGPSATEISAASLSTVAADHDITIRDLLTHTSGFASNGMTGDLTNKLLEERTPEDTLATFVPRAAAALPLDFQPGTKWQYSNFLGFETLARVVEIVSGMSYDQFLRQHMFEPLGMKDAYFAVTVPKDRAARLVTTYRKIDGTLRPTPDAEDPAIARPKYFSGSGGLATTAEDYAQFAQMMLNGGQLNGKHLLSPTTVGLISSNHVGKLYNVPGFGFGLGVEVLMDPAEALTISGAGSYDWNGAFGTSYWIDPKNDLVAVIMIQTWGNPAITNLRRDFRTAVTQAIVN